MAKIVISQDRCKGCRYCVETCPKKSIEISEKINILGYYPAVFNSKNQCSGCALCAEICPDVCIEVYKDE